MVQIQKVLLQTQKIQIHPNSTPAELGYSIKLGDADTTQKNQISWLVEASDPEGADTTFTATVAIITAAITAEDVNVIVEDNKVTVAASEALIELAEYLDESMEIEFDVTVACTEDPGKTDTKRGTITIE